MDVFMRLHASRCSYEPAYLGGLAWPRVGWCVLMFGLIGCSTPTPLSKPIGSSEVLHLDLSSQPVPDFDLASQRALEEGVSGYLEVGLKRSPALRAVHARWRATTLESSVAGSWPEPSLKFAAFLSAIETRVGPQQGRVGFEQRLPWPGMLEAKASGMRWRADAQYFALERLALTLIERIEHAYWGLWKLRATRAIHREHLLILESLAESVRARVATGASGLSALQQVELARTRVADSIAGQDERERILAANLRSLIGARSVFDVPTPEGPSVVAPVPFSSEDLIAQALRHPQLQEVKSLKQAAELDVDVKRFKRYPEFRLGADWTIIGDHVMDGERHNGKDALSFGAGLSLPLWQDTYADAIEAAELQARAQAFQEDDLRNRLVARAIEAEAVHRDTFRRLRVYRDALVPQADDAYRSVLGSYTVGRGSIAQMLMAQRDLLELKVEYEETKAELELARATLNQVLGKGLKRHASDGAKP